MRDVRGKQFTIIGAARSGLAAARLLRRHGANVFVTDSGSGSDEARAQLAEIEGSFEFGGHSPRAREADFFVISPGVPDDVPFVASLIADGLPLYSEVEVASWFCRAPIVAITGSNGKTTTTALTAHVFRKGGRRTSVAGNIGDPFSDVADRLDDQDLLVLEVSSFQLDHIASFRPRVSVILNITPDHLDRYQNDFQRYADSKARIFENQGEGDAIVYNADDRVVRERVSDRQNGGVSTLAFSTEAAVEQGVFVRERDIVFRLTNQEETLMPYEEISLRGRHNLYNSLAASMAARFLEVSNDAIRESMRTFEGVPHRLELVREVDGIRFVNDSKATNVNAVWYALESFDEPIVLIAGGQDKGNDYDEIIPLVSAKVRALITMGSGAEGIEAALGPHVPWVARAESLDAAVKKARSVARSGDIVLLSPACASFDMFENYEHRGEVFRRAVERLQGQQ